MYNEKLAKKVDVLHEELVPFYGKADSVAGEIIRCICILGHRYYNDGERLGRDYGFESCNAPAFYLLTTIGKPIKENMDALVYAEEDSEYDDALEDLTKHVYEYVVSHPELKDEKNSIDGIEYKPWIHGEGCYDEEDEDYYCYDTGWYDKWDFYI